MSDPPPKKVGSLRDRIAAFENKGSAPAPAPPPAPRPKPGHINWTPKPLSPPTSPKASSSGNDESAEARKAAGMSATDAKESIGKLSLKERMAALQGSGGFSGPGAAATPPPRPSGEKPKWKPPPVVQRVEPIGGDDEEDKPAEVKLAEREHADEPKSPEEANETKESEQEPKEEGESDPQEEERQRRAALAARMARLGGARVGMGPPIFGKKPDVPPKKVHKEEEEAKEEEPPKEKPAEVSPTAEDSDVPAVVEPASTAEGETVGSTDYFDAAKKDSATSATLSPDSAVTSPPVRSPAMPVPQVPRRAAPPRKRAGKSPSPAAPVIGQELHESPAALPSTEESAAPAEKEDVPSATEGPHGDREPELTEGHAEKLEENVPATEPTQEHEVTEAAGETETPSVHEVAEEEHTTEPITEGVVHDPLEHVTEEHDETSAVEEPKHKEAPVVEEPKHEESPSEVDAPAEEPVEEPEEEEDEAARRKRIADRIAKSGGFNPFSGGMPPPVRKDSTGSVRSPITSPPSQPVRRDSQQDTASLQSPPLLPTSPKPQAPARKDSVGSVRAEAGLGPPLEEASLDDQRAESDDDGAIAEEDEEEEVRGRSLERSAPAYEDVLGEAPEDEDAGARAEHEAVHSLANEEEYGKAHHGADDYRNARERQEVPEHATEGYGEREVPQPPPRVPRPLPTLPPTQTRESAEEDADPLPPATSPPPPPARQFIPPPPKRVSLPPPPPRTVPVPPTAPSEEDIDDERVASPDVVDEANAIHAREIGLEQDEDEHVHQLHEDEHYEDEHVHDGYDEHPTKEEEEEPEVESAPPPPPRRLAVPPPPLPVQADEDEQEEDVDFEVPPPPPPPRRASVQVPPPPTHALPHGEDKEEDVSEYEETEEEEEAFAPPPPPPRHAAPAVFAAALSRPVPPPIRAPSPDVDEEEEVLNDSDVDPIDPEFYSPKSPGLDPRAGFPSALQSPPARVISPPPPPPARVVSPPPQQVASPPPPPPFQRVVSPPPPTRVVSPPAVTSPASQPEHSEAGDEEDGENSELARRRTIAERMAKLGGIRFGAPPPVPAARRPPPPPEPEHEEGGEGDEREESDKPAEEEEGEAAPVEEEDEFSRKQRIAARIAGMGGQRFGMIPGMGPPARAPVRRESEDEAPQVKSPPPKRFAPIAPPPPPPARNDEHEEESDYQHVSDSERVAHEESELEEVTYTDAEEAAPPPAVPDRGARRVSTGPPPVPQTRPLSPPSLASPPPVPKSRPPQPPAFTYPPPPPSRPTPTTRETHGDFVIVDQGQSAEESAPPPPSRAARPPPRGAPVPPPPPAPQTSDAQWEEPVIPDVDFGGETDLSLSAQWSEDSTNYPPVPPGRPSASVAPAPPQQQTSSAPATQPPAEQHLSPEELMGHWGRVGVQIHEVAAALFERSKKGVVGDGSYIGFVTAALGQVPNAAQPAPPFESFGYLVYHQTAAAVQRRVSDIMPGDVLVAHEAKFKGHKGLQSYHQNVGVGQPLVAVIGDFETKKSKVRVFQANQHVGQQSVESASYRLEDLKSGSVKIFRVLEA